MRTKALLALPILLLVSVIARSQTVTNVSITGNFTVGSQVSASYIVQGSAPDTIFSWYEVSLTDTVPVGSGDTRIVIPATSLNKRILLEVSLETAGVVIHSAYSPLSPVVTPNKAPVASSVTISGSLDVNEYLLGNYSYSDAEGDTEGNSIFEWWISSSPTGLPETIIPGENNRIFKLRLSDQGQYLIFKVVPVAGTGTPEGVKVTSTPFGKVNSAPYATSVAIIGVPALGNTLTGTYQFNDPDGDSQGTSIFRWYRDNVTIAGETNNTLLLTNDDVGSRIHFEVTPVSLTGYPNTGMAASSAQTDIVSDPTGDKPEALDVCINGDRKSGSVLTGRYTFTDPKFREQNSKYFWYRGSERVLIGTGLTYTMTGADMEADIYFAVIPRNNKGVEGAERVSSSLAMINLPVETFSIADPPVVLTATPTGGIFHGPGVTGGSFSPSLAGEGGPFTINYLLEIRNATNTCTQNSSKSVFVNPVTSWFDSFRNVYCHDGGPDTIYVRNVPAGATGKTFGITSPGAIISFLSDTSVIIDPGRMRPGNKIDTLFYSYMSGGSFYPVSKPFVIDSVGTALSFAGLDAAYCEASARRFVSVLGLYPSGGTGTWTGTIVSGQSVASAFIEPEMGSPGSIYPVTYRYTSPLGCNTPLLSQNVRINPLPDAGFPLKPIYNVDGPGETLVPVTTGGTFIGPGISGYTFYPGIAREGTHQIKYTITDSNGCTSDSTKTTEVRKASGVIAGINPGNQYCYDGQIDTLRFESSAPWISGHFSGPGMMNISSATGTFTPSVAGPGDHRIVFTYTDLAFTTFEIVQIVNVDSVGQVMVENLDPGSVFCTGDASFILYTNKDEGVFTGPVTGRSFDPSKGPGNTPVVFTYINNKTGCSSSVSIPVTINASPNVAFTVADFCIEHDNDTTRFLNSTTPADSVKRWLWEFQYGGGVMISENESPGFLYTTGGLHQVRLTATTLNDCASSLERTIDLGVKPEADFYWLNECLHPDDSVHIFDRTLKGSPVIARAWNFFDGNPPLTTLNPRYPKLAAGFLPVEYIVHTNYVGCGDTARKEIFIRPTIKLSTDDYYEDFESGPGGWIADQGTRNTWSFGTPDRPVINSAASGFNAWYTSYDIASQAPAASSVTSPCFDFSETVRPMISLSIWRRFDRNRDGAAIQYKVGDHTDWEYLGTLGDGIDWFNSTLIKGRPGGDQIGWTTISSPDAGWKEARRRLDELNGKRDVKFRIAYGSDGTSQENDGFAVDDIRIGTRTRNVLLEHFTNNSSSAVVRANQIVKTMSSAMKSDVININYHTNFPGSDLLYNDIPADMSARMLFYGLTRVPWSIIDGGTRNQHAGIYDYLVADLDSTELQKRSLISPQFTIEIDPVVSGGMLQIGARLTSREDLNEENLTLYIAVTAREISSVSSPNGETLFRNTLRKMLPDAGGTNLSKIWTMGQTFESPDFSWKIANIYDSKDIEIIAFIQNNNTRKVYQAVAAPIRDISVGVESVYGENARFSLFPNPTSGRLVISFDEPLRIRSTLEIIDQAGRPVKRFNAEAGQTSLEIDNVAVADGVYLVRMTSGNHTLGLRRLIVSGAGR